MASGRRIVFVQSGLGAGGAEKIVHLLAEHRCGRDDAVLVLAFAHRPEASYFAYPPEVALRTMEGDGERDGGGLLGMLRRVIWLRRRFREFEPDLIVSFLTKINVLSMLARIGLGRPAVVSERNNPGKQDASRLWNLASAALLGGAARIVMQTEAARRTLPRRLHGQSVVIANPAVIPQRFMAPAARPQEVLAVGRLADQKGFDLLLRAFAALDDRHGGWRLSIWGDGPARAELEALIRELGLEGRARLRGTTSEALGWLDSGEVYVLSSRFEGFPNALVEAMAGGLAPIAFDCDWGPADLIRDGENGLLVPNGDVAGLTAALSRVLGDADLRARLQQAARAVSDSFSRTAILAQWDEAFDAALAQRGHG